MSSSVSVPFAALCAVVGCTAIIDGEFDASPAAPPIAHGSQSGLEGVDGASLGGDASAVQGGSGSVPVSPDASAAGAAGDRAPGGGAGGAPASESGGDAGAVGMHLEGGMSSGGAEHAAAGAATGGEPASGGTSSGANGGSAGTTGGGMNDDVITWKGPLPPGDPARGLLLVIADRCSSCHAENFGGRGFYRNITPDLETGIGSWTDRQIANAIRGGGGPGTQFCSVMPLYSGLKDRQVADMVAYLRSVPAISNQIVSICPGHYPPGG